MAELEPGQLFTHDVPIAQAVLDAVEVRNNFTALARTLYTTDPVNPLDKRQGMMRILADPAEAPNKKLQAFLDGDWRTLLQNIAAGIAAPVKQIVQIAAASNSWVVDHNLGSQPLVQIYDATFKKLEAKSVNPEAVTQHLGFIPAAVLTTLAPGATILRAAIPLDINGTFLQGYGAVADALTGAPVGTIDFEISGAGVMTGGNLALAVASLGAIIPGVGASANNSFVRGNTLEVRAAITTAPTGGALDIYGQYQPGLQAGQYQVDHVNENRFIVTHPTPITGFVVLVG